MNSISASLPEPIGAAAAISERLIERIESRMREAGGWLPFEDYMRLALYEPGLGYYSAGSAKLGPSGDFVTAPELGNFLAEGIAASFAPMLAHMRRPSIVELGAGTGRLAVQLLEALAARGLGAVEYWILEPSADLRERQRGALAAYGPRVRWLEAPPAQAFEGLVLANEVLDALPVARFLKHNGRIRPLGVAVSKRGFAWAPGPVNAELERAVQALETRLGRALEEPYESELCLLLAPWIALHTAGLRSGAALFIDYGLVRREYYHAQRSTGTLICHYRHRAHSNPFVYPGLTDISAWVDFSACAEASLAAGLELAGFTTQASFLLACLESDGAGLAERTPEEQSALKTLLLPGEMGEKFKLMLLSKKQAGLRLPGKDLRNRL